MSALIRIDEDELIDFQLFGVISDISNSFQFAYKLNQSFQSSFKRIDDLDVQIAPDVTVFYPIYEWRNKEQLACYHLIKNISYQTINKKKEMDLFNLFDATPFLIPQHKQYNYILRVSEADEISISEINFKENSFIRQITKFDLDTIKTKNRLIF